MTELSELEAYKQLLQVTENILQQLTPQQQILHKYFTLKKSIFTKIKPSQSQSQISSNIAINTPKILSCYKTITKNIIQCLSEFQAQIQGEMNKNNFMKNAGRFIKNIQRQIKIVNQQITNTYNYNNDNKNIKLMMKQQINSIKFINKQLQGKIQNMGLMIQVHRKMHQIILQASEKQAKTTQKQIEYNKRLNQMEDVVEQVHDVRKFIDSYQITEKKARKFQMARKNLAKVLFDI